MPVQPLPPPETLEKQLITLLSERVLETAAPVGADTDLYALGMDSMAIMQLLILVEEEYGVALPESSLTRDGFTTPRQLARLVRAHGGGSA